MKKIHRAIRPAVNEGEYFIYDIEYIKDGIEVDIVNTTIHLVDKDGKVGENILPPEMVQDDATQSGSFNILYVDGVLKVDPEED